MKKFVSLLLIMLLALSAPLCAFAGTAMSALRPTVEYKEGQFTDVKTTDWFAENVKTAFRLGLLTGTSENKFSPDGYVTRAQAVTIAARIHSIFNTGNAAFTASNPWYQTYVDYAKESGILASDFDDYSKNATRAEFAVLLAASLPESELPELNIITDTYIPDVSSDDDYADAVYLLYRAGVLTGSGSTGAFKPDTNLKRSEMAAMVTRMADNSLRKQFAPLVSYSGYYPAPDFGYYTGLPCAEKSYSEDVKADIYLYDETEVTDILDRSTEYGKLLAKLGFELLSVEKTDEDIYVAAFENKEAGLMLYLSDIPDGTGRIYAMVAVSKTN